MTQSKITTREGEHQMADGMRYFHDHLIRWRVHPNGDVEHLLDGEWVESLATLQALVLSADVFEDFEV